MRSDYDPKNSRVASDDVDIDGANYLVSTIDLGLDHSFGEGAPLYYETKIFPKGEWGEVYCNRYTTREQAENAHTKLVADIKSGAYEMADGWLERKTEQK